MREFVPEIARLPDVFDRVFRIRETRARQAAKIITTAYGTSIEKVLLFGRVKKRKQTLGSDTDLAVVFKDDLNHELIQRIRSQLQRAGFALGEYRNGIHLQWYTHTKFEQGDSPAMRAVRDGKVLV